MLWITVTHSRSPGWNSSGRAPLSAPVTTFIEPITPIWKPVSSKLCTSSWWTLYLAWVSSISLNHAPIISVSSWSILYLSLARLKAILSSAERVTERSAQHLPTGLPPRTASSLSAISATSHSRGANPRELRSNIYRRIVFSSVAVSLCWALRVSRRCVSPLYRRASVARGTLNASAARRRLGNWQVL
jgi:hypothetical protein